MKSNNIKILHLFNEINFSGAEVMFANAAALFHEQGIDLYAVATGRSIGNYERVFCERGISCEHRPVPSSRHLLALWSYYWRLYRYVGAGGFRAIHVHRNDLWLPSVVAFFARVRCIKTQHSVFRNRWFTRPVGIARRWLVRTVFGTIFHSISESVEQNERIYYKNPTVRINNWFDPGRFFPPNSLEEKQGLRDKLAIPHDTVVVISTGSCTHNKNHHDILRALASLGMSRQWLYLHLGSGPTEAEESEIARASGIVNQVCFLGNQRDVRLYLAAADIFVMPSHFEGLGIAALEAMACGLPLIAYNVPGLRDLVKDNDSGFLVEEYPEFLSEGIRKFADDDHLRVEKGTAARKRAMTEYSMEAGVAALVELYTMRADKYAQEG